MAWTYLAASGESAKPWHHGSGLPHIVKTTTLPKEFFSPECSGEKLTLPQSGMTSKPLRGGVFLTSTSSQAAGLARETALQELGRAWQTSEAVLSQKSLGLFATFDPATSSWKTCQGSLLLQGTGLDSSSINWPNAGMTQGGQCFQLRKLVPPTDGTASGSSQRRMVSAWPTPTASDDHTGNLSSTQQKEGSMHSVTLPQIAERTNWRTPDTGAGGASGRLARGEKVRPSGAQITMRLEDQVKLWERDRKPVRARPSPLAADADHLGRTTSSGGQEHLPEVAMNFRGKVSPWVTPLEDDANQATRDSGAYSSLTRQVRGWTWSTPAVNDSKNNAAPSQLERNSDALNVQAYLFSQHAHPIQPRSKGGKKSLESSRRLNPLFVEWLMGYELGITRYEAWAIALTLSVRGKRSKSCQD